MTIPGFARVAVVWGAALATVTPLAANANGYLVQSFPGPKMHLNESPRYIRLKFSLRMDAKYSKVRLEREDGTVLATKTLPKASHSFNMVAPKLPPGAYRVHYRMLPPDGHLLRGDVSFIIDKRHRKATGLG